MKVELDIEYGRSGLPMITPEHGARLRVVADGRQVHITANREGLLLLARSAVGLANLEQRPEHVGYHIHLDEVYGVSTESNEVVLYRED